MCGESDCDDTCMNGTGQDLSYYGNIKLPEPTEEQLNEIYRRIRAKHKQS